MASPFSRPITIFGLLLLAHAYVMPSRQSPSPPNSPVRSLILPRPRRCYSAYEHSSLHTTAPQSSTIGITASSRTDTAASLPLDISLETIISVVFICVGLVIGAEELKPITWRVWAGQAERESGGGGPFQGLEEMLGFVDIRVRFAAFPHDRHELRSRPLLNVYSDI